MTDYMKNKNILELCLAHGLGGLEMFSVSCYKHFSQKTNCKIVVVPDQKLDKYIESEDKYLVKRSKLFPVFPALKLAKYIDQNDIDIVHFHWTRDMITAVLAKVLSKKKPKLIQSRHMGMTRFKDDFYHKWLYSKIDMMHAVTYKVKEQLEKFIPSVVLPKTEMVYLGTEALSIDEEVVQELKDKYKSNGEFIVGIVGRIEEPKGQYKVIEALKQLQDKNIKLLIVGSAMEEEYLQRLKQEVKELDLEEKVTFTGFTKNVNEYMQIFDINILATTNETFGLVVIEAMINKVPVIATNKGGPLEIIEDGVDGLLFDGSSNDLAVKIEKLFESKELQSSIRENAFQTASKRFDKDTQLREIYDIIGRI
ncbi:glycosyltransferase family 4 protein [Sulfurimonas sp.]|nr:glycosyltransferase family 4 protein [Sulfurimonas sp.]